MPMASHRIYCSKNCSNNRPYPSKTFKRTYVDCQVCGIRFFNRPCEKHKSCSRACANIWQARNKVRTQCKMCGAAISACKNNPTTYCSIVCRWKDPDTLAHLAKMRDVSQRHVGPTSIEVIGYSMLDDSGIPYLKQHVISRFRVDSFVPSCNLVVQFDGDYWHGLPSLYPNPTANQKQQQSRDKGQDTWLVNHGYSVIRFWEHEINKQPDMVRVKLMAALSKTQTPIIEVPVASSSDPWE